MDTHLKLAARWVLVLVTFSGTTLLLFILLMGLMSWPDRPLVAAFTAIGLDPRATIEAAHQFDLLAAILLWVMPSASAIAFAARKPQRRALNLGLSVSVLLFATIFFFFFGWQERSASMEWVAATATILAMSAMVFSFLKIKFLRSLTLVNSIAILLLFSPSILALSRRTRAIPQARELWSTTLQQEQWQSMNTGSEYSATRQVAFAGDRVIAVFDTGLGPSHSSKDKWPVSTYRLISLGLKTGVKLKEIIVAGRWGSMPYIYPTQEGFINVQSNPPLILDPDLAPVTDAYTTAPANRTMTRESRECGGANCDPPTYVLGKNTVQLRHEHFQVVDSAGQVLSGGSLVVWGSFAGASADGRRFAIQSSYSEGDPDFVVYEYFTVYDAVTGKALAMVHMKDLPARQSWSAFSSNGQYFAAGNPNKLTMYELP